MKIHTSLTIYILFFNLYKYYPKLNNKFIFFIKKYEVLNKIILKRMQNKLFNKDSKLWKKIKIVKYGKR